MCKVKKKLFKSYSKIEETKLPTSDDVLVYFMN